MEDNDLRKENLRIDNLRNMITRDINMSHLPVGMVYYILKDALNEIGDLFTQQANQEYKEYCDLMNKEDAEAAQRALESEEVSEASSSKDEELVSANDNKEGTN